MDLAQTRKSANSTDLVTRHKEEFRMFQKKLRTKILFIKTMNIQQNRQLARDENTASEILTNLAKSNDYQTLQYVIANPNTPTEILFSLGAKFPEELLANPIFDLLNLENLYFIDNYYYFQLELAQNNKTPLAFLKYLMQYGRYGVRKYIARHHSTSIEMLTIMTEEAIQQQISNDETTIAITSNPKTSTELLEKLSTSFWSKMKIDQVFFRDDSINLEIKLGVALASHPNTSAYILNSLANSKRKQILLSVIKNCQASVSLLKKIALKHKEDRDIIRAIVSRVDMTKENLSIFSIDNY